MRKSAIKRGFGWFLAPGIVLFTFLVFGPFLANIGISFTRWNGIGTPTWIGLANYQKAITDETFWASFRNNLSLIVAMTIIPTVFGLFLAAFLFDWVAPRVGNGTTTFFRAGFYLPQVIPIIVAATIWRWMYQPEWGAINYVLGRIGLESWQQNWLGERATAMPSVMAVMVWFQLGYPLVIFMAGLQRIDPEMYEAAALDGATWFRRFRSITVWLLMPEIWVVVLTTMIHALKVFAPIYALTSGGPGNATIVAAYFSYRNFFERSQVGYGAAVATVLTAVILVVAVVQVRMQTRQESWGE